MKGPRFFNALPAYIGGKRRLVALIFALVARVTDTSTWRGQTFIDPFLGGGSVSLAAKAHGFRVLCNDLALRSAAIGHGLIENGSAKLSPAAVVMLLQEPNEPYQTLAADRYAPSVLPLAHARLLDRVLANLDLLPEPVRSLAIVLLMKWLLRIQPMSLIRGTDAKAAHEGDFDQVSPRRLGHYMKAGKLLEVRAWLSLAEEVNLGVFPGQGKASQLDVFEFLAQVEGDVVYLDPPYPGTTSYEREYAVLDDLLEGEKRPMSGFSRSADLLTDLFRESPSGELLNLIVSVTHPSETVPAELKDQKDVILRRVEQLLGTEPPDDLPFTHGGRIYKWGSDSPAGLPDGQEPFNQLESHVIPVLKENPRSRRALVGIRQSVRGSDRGSTRTIDTGTAGDPV